MSYSIIFRNNLNRKAPDWPKPPAPRKLETYELKLDDWEEAEGVAQGYILQTIKQGPKAHLSQEMDAPTMFSKLKETYKLNGYTERYLGGIISTGQL